MKQVLIVALIAFLAVSAHVVLADDCDDGECTSTVSVTQYFETNNCSGNATLAIGTNYTTACQVYDDSNFNYSINFACSAKSGFSSATTNYATTCAKSSKTFNQNFAVGVCVKNGRSSYINWCNQASISSNFKAVKNYTVEKLFQPAGPCNMTTGCPKDIGSIKLYANNTCTGPITGLYPASAFADGLLVPGVCYTTNGSVEKRRDSESSHFVNEAATSEFSTNRMVTCGNGQYRIINSVGGCGSSATFLSAQSFPTDTCVFIEGQWAVFSCPSAASALVAGPLVFLLLLVAFLFV